MKHLPNHFLWGASTASHQVEGNTNNQWTVWERANAKRLAATADNRLSWMANYAAVQDKARDPENYISGNGVDHYHHYREDFDILSKLNMNSFRFGIEWSRIEPQPGQWDNDAIAHYQAYIAELKSRNIEPILTLWHWTMPTWFTDAGGFSNKQNIAIFERYVAKIAELFASDLRYVITLNEPNVYTAFSYITGEWPPQHTSKREGLRVYRNLMEAHRRSYRALKAANPAIQVGIAAQLADMQPTNPHNLCNVTTLAVRKRIWNWWFLDAVRHHQDFIGLNYYFTEHVNWRGQIKNPPQPTSDVGWYMEPRGISTILQDTWKRYNTPVIVTENGLADSTDIQRKWWLEQTLAGLDDALAQGVDIRGYLHWSLLDNFEWAYGWWPQFGLVAVDRSTLQRTIRPSAQWFADVIAEHSSTSS